MRLAGAPLGDHWPANLELYLRGRGHDVTRKPLIGCRAAPRREARYPLVCDLATPTRRPLPHRRSAIASASSAAFTDRSAGSVISTLVRAPRYDCFSVTCCRLD